MFGHRETFSRQEDAQWVTLSFSVSMSTRWLTYSLNVRQERCIAGKWRWEWSSSSFTGSRREDHVQDHRSCELGEDNKRKHDSVRREVVDCHDQTFPSSTGAIWNIQNSWKLIVSHALTSLHLSRASAHKQAAGFTDHEVLHLCSVLSTTWDGSKEKNSLRYSF